MIFLYFLFLYFLFLYFLFLYFLFWFTEQKYVYLSVLSSYYITSTLNKYHFLSINLILTASDDIKAFLNIIYYCLPALGPNHAVSSRLSPCFVPLTPLCPWFTGRLYRQILLLCAIVIATPTQTFLTIRFLVL